MPNPVYFRDREQLRQSGGLKVVDPDTAITMIRDLLLFLDIAPRTATADVAMPIVGGQKFDGVFLCSKIFRTPNQKNPDGNEQRAGDTSLDIIAHW